MVIGIRILYCLFAITLLSSCGTMWIPIDSPEPERPSYDMLDELIGQSREVVVEKLGVTNVFTLDDRQFMLYTASATITSTRITWVIIPIPTGGKKTRLTTSCLMIELGSDNLVKQYKFKNTSTEYGDTNSKCLRRFLARKN